MAALAAKLEVEKRNSADLQHRLAQSEATSRTDSRTVRDQLQANARRARELEVEVSNLVMLLVMHCVVWPLTFSCKAPPTLPFAFGWC